jgi:hypothetical protein
LNASRLRTDGLYLGDIGALGAGLASVGLSSETAQAEATTHCELLSVLGELTRDGRTFDVVVVVGHSNAKGIGIAADWPLASWAEFSNYIEPLKPRRLLLVACQAGRWDAGEALFTGNRLLRRIYACPVNASRNFGALLMALVPYVVATRRPTDKHVLWSQLAAVGLTGRQLREWRRTQDKGRPERVVFDFLADRLDPYARELPKALGAIVQAVARRR